MDASSGPKPGSRYRKLLLLLSPALFFFGVCGWNVWGSFGKVLEAQEAQATATIPVAQFAARYRVGQRWVELEGKLALGHYRTEPVASRVPERRLLAIVAPLVPPDWQPTDPVHVFVHCATVEPHEMKGKLAELQGKPLTRVSSPPIPRQLEVYAKLFPELVPAEPLILVNYGTEKPDVPSTVAYFLLLLTILIVWLVFLIRQIRREFARIDEPGGNRGQ